MKKVILLLITFFILTQSVFASNSLAIFKNKDYDWYVSQKNSGLYSKINCGPAVAVMALKWLKKDISFTVEDARKSILPNGGNWYSKNIKQYIEDNGGKVSEIAFPSEEKMIKKLENSIFILCVDSGMLYKEKRSNTGHFIVVSAYLLKTKKIIVNDPQKYTMGDTYKYETLSKAAKDWWNYALEITEK